MYLKQIQQLVVLQHVDDERLELEHELEQAPAELAELEGKVSGLNERKAQIQEKIDILHMQQQRLDTEIEEDNHKVKKSKNKLMMVGNTREYHAMMREMDSLEKLNRMREEERVALIEELGNQQNLMEELDGEMAVAKEELAAKQASLEERLKTARDRLSVLDKKRQEAGKAVPKPIMGRYEFIRQRLDNPVIVPVCEGVCGGCNIKVPPQIYNDLQKGQQIISCPNCQRLIFWSEHIPENGEEGKEKK